MTHSDPPNLIVSGDWLAEHLDDPDLVIVDVRPEDHYAAGHIPGARNLDLYPLKILQSDPDAIASWVKTMESAFQNVGIAHNSRVVFYEDISGMSAARGVWLMYALSIGDGAMLDGGLSAWRAAGDPISIEPVSAASSELNATLNPEMFITADEILRHINEPEDDRTIIDTRNQLEWIQGTIPSARHLEWVNHLNHDGTFKPVAELRDMYSALGLAPDGAAITFCATGYRAAHTWLVLKMLGYENVSAYAPSWTEWGSRRDLPVEDTR